VFAVVDVAHWTPPSPDLDGAPPPPPPAPATPNWRGGLQPLGLLALVGAGCAYVAIMNPNESAAYPQCPLRTLTGLDCPGCGLTRAVYALMHADPLRAIDHNLLVVLLLPLAVYAFVRWTAQRLGYELNTLPRWRPWMSVAVGVALFGFLVVRNLPGLDWLRSSAG
jgi:hypothetical protein